MSRQAVTKHLNLLEEANLVATVKRGREKLHYLNPVPINEIYMRWIGKFEQDRVQALHNLKQALRRKTNDPSPRPNSSTPPTSRTHAPVGVGRHHPNPEFARPYWGQAQYLGLEARLQMGHGQQRRHGSVFDAPARFWKAVRPAAWC